MNKDYLTPQAQTTVSEVNWRELESNTTVDVYILRATACRPGSFTERCVSYGNSNPIRAVIEGNICRFPTLSLPVFGNADHLRAQIPQHCLESIARAEEGWSVALYFYTQDTKLQCHLPSQANRKYLIAGVYKKELPKTVEQILSNVVCSHWAQAQASYLRDLRFTAATGLKRKEFANKYYQLIIANGGRGAVDMATLRQSIISFLLIKARLALYEDNMGLAAELARILVRVFKPQNVLPRTKAFLDELFSRTREMWRNIDLVFDQHASRLGLAEYEGFAEFHTILALRMREARQIGQLSDLPVADTEADYRRKILSRPPGNPYTEGFELFETVAKSFGEDFTFGVGDIAFHPFEILRNGCPSSILTTLQNDSSFAPDHRLRQLAKLSPPIRIKEMGADRFLEWLNRNLDDKLGNPLEIIHNHLRTL